MKDKAEDQGQQFKQLIVKPTNSLSKSPSNMPQASVSQFDIPEIHAHVGMKCKIHET